MNQFRVRLNSFFAFEIDFNYPFEVKTYHNLRTLTNFPSSLILKNSRTATVKYCNSAVRVQAGPHLCVRSELQHLRPLRAGDMKRGRIDVPDEMFDPPQK